MVIVIGIIGIIKIIIFIKIIGIIKIIVAFFAEPDLRYTNFFKVTGSELLNVDFKAKPSTS